MNRMIRILLVLAALAGMAALGLSGTAWADKLRPGGLVPSAGNAIAEVLAPPRQTGTSTTGPLTIPVTGGQASTLGSCATVTSTSAPAGVVYTASVVPESTLPKTLPGTLLSCGVKVEAKPNADLGAPIAVCFPLGPDNTGVAYYWDGTQWVKTTTTNQNGQSCVDMPASTANPAYAALFDK
jgi:hypothetical protein